jgi:hypothetical protein
LLYMALPSLYLIKTPFHLNTYALLVLIIFDLYFVNEKK